MPPRSRTHVCPDTHPHDLKCYVTHKCSDDQCRAVNAAYNRFLRAAKKAGRYTAGQDIDATGTRRRVHALNCLGWSTPVVFARAGLGTRGRDTISRDRVHVKTAYAIRRVYDELSMRRPPETTRGERVSAVRTRMRAHRGGYADPFAWEGVDIDDPAAEPDMETVSDEPGWVLTELEHLHALGESATVALATVPIEPASLERQALRHKRPDLAAWIRTAA